MFISEEKLTAKYFAYVNGYDELCLTPTFHFVYKEPRRRTCSKGATPDMQWFVIVDGDSDYYSFELDKCFISKKDSMIILCCEDVTEDTATSILTYQSKRPSCTAINMPPSGTAATTGSAGGGSRKARKPKSAAPKRKPAAAKKA